MAADGDARPQDATTEADDEAAFEAYFQELNDGGGCTEIWEYLSDRRRRE